MGMRTRAIRRSRFPLAGVAVVTVALLAAANAQAFPGRNGSIAFTGSVSPDASCWPCDSGVYLMNADGTGRTRLSPVDAIDYAPTWSADGKKIAFVRIKEHGNGDIYTMNADGSEVFRLTHTPYVSEGKPSWSPDGQKITFPISYEGIYVMDTDGNGTPKLIADGSDPVWSPDGSRIAFTGQRTLPDYGGTDSDVYTMNPDGSGKINVTRNDNNDEFYPAWSPDSKRIAFTRFSGWSSIHVTNADGSNTVPLTPQETGYAPAWSPDGTKIAFSRDRSDNSNWEIYVMNSDGSGQVRLTDGSKNTSFSPDWGAVASPGAAQPEFSQQAQPALDDRTTAFSLLSIRSKQRLSRLSIQAAMNESGTIIATGTVRIARKSYGLKTTSVAVSPGVPVRLRLRLPGNAVKAAKRALRNHRKLKALITITAADRLGNRKVARRTVKLRA